MASNVKGKAVAEILMREDVIKAFADQQNPIQQQVVDSLQHSVLNSVQVFEIKKAFKEGGPITGGAKLRECLVHRYNDEPEKNVQQLIDALVNINSNVQLRNLLLSNWESSVKGQAVVDLLKREDVIKAFAHVQNPIEMQIVDSLKDSLLTEINIFKIKKANEEGGPASAGALLRQILIHRYTDQPNVFTLKQFTDALQTKIHLRNLLLSDSTGSALFADDETLVGIVTKLRQYYIKRFSKYAPSPLAEPFSIKDVWVNLAFSKGLSKLQSGQYLEMLRQAYKEDQSALLIGQPGEGKTMTMKRIGFDWANDNFLDYDLVLCVPLRDIQDTAASILDMALKNMQSHNILKEADVSYLQKIKEKDKMVGEPKVEHYPSNQLHVLIVLDGYDEFSSGIECEELTQLLFNRDLPNLDYCVLVTSRPYAVDKVHAAAPKLVIEPLDEEKQAKYMFQHFKHESPDDDPTEKVEKLEDLLLDNPSLQQPAKTPLLLYFICILSNVLTPTDSAVHLYRLLFNAMVERYESTMSSLRRLLRRSMAGVFKEPFDNICGKSGLIYNLGKLALTGLVGDNQYAPDKLQFTEDDLNNLGINVDYCVKVGFLNVQLQGRFGEKIYEFPHKTIQEFFAALLLFHELSTSEEIEIVKDKQDNPIIKNGDRLFQRHPLLNQFFNTTKFNALEQLFSFVLEMSADAYKNNEQSSHHSTPIANAPNIFQRIVRRLTGTQEAHGRRVSNTISFFLAWANQNLNQGAFLSVPILRTLLTHLSHCSEETEIRYQLKIYLNAIMFTEQYDSQSLLRHFFTCNIFMYRLGDVCIYIPDLNIIFVMDQSSINQNILCHAIPISYEQLKMKCGSQFKMCFVDFSSLQILSQVSEAIECEKIVFMKINITGISSAINQSNSELLKEKLQVHSVHLTFQETVKSPFDLMPVWNSCGSSFTNIRFIRIESKGNNLQVIGLDQIFGQSDIRNSLEYINLTTITFPTEQAVVLLAEQLKQFRSLDRFIIGNYASISEEYLFMLLKCVKEAGVSDLTVFECCLRQTETFHKFCSLLEQWHHLRKLDFRGMFLSSDLIDILCNTLSLLPDLEELYLQHSDVKEKHMNRLKQTNSKLLVTY